MYCEGKALRQFFQSVDTNLKACLMVDAFRGGYDHFIEELQVWSKLCCREEQEVHKAVVLDRLLNKCTHSLVLTQYV